MDLLDAAKLPPLDGTKTTTDATLIEQQHTRASTLHEKAVAKYNERMATDVDETFAINMLKGGTLADKVSAAVLLVQRSPLHKLDILGNVLISGMATKKSKREAILASDSIKDLFVTNLLPDNRKLRFFRDQPLAAEGILPRHLVIWYFEDELKKMYFSYIQVLEQLSKDALLFVRTKACQLIFELLQSKPEQEQNLLALLVNKVGDHERKVSSKVVHLLSQLITKHPAMKETVVHYVEQFVFRPNVELKAQYYAITFLNQVALSNTTADVEVARKLISTYFALFDKYAGDKEKYLSVVSHRKQLENPTKKGPKKGKKGKKGMKKGKDSKKADDKPEVNAEQVAAIDSKIMAAILIGVTRAFPYANLDKDVYERHLDTLFRISHYGSFTVLVQSLTLIFQIQSPTDDTMDRFYRTLYDSILNPSLLDSSRQAMYLNLLFRAMKRDYSDIRVKAFVKRILQMCSLAQAHLICGALFVISEVAKQKPAIWDLLKRSKPLVQNELAAKEMVNDDASDDDVEHFKDVVDSDTEMDHSSTTDKTTTKQQSPIEKVKESAMDVDNKSEQVAKVSIQGSTTMLTGYDPLKREPLFAKADSTFAYEILAFENHFHPTVALYAESLRKCEPIVTPPGSVNYDPLQNHTLMKFLDKFVLKNPKQHKTPYKGASLMQPKVGVVDNGRIISAYHKAS